VKLLAFVRSVSCSENRAAFSFDDAQRIIADGRTSCRDCSLTQALALVEFHRSRSNFTQCCTKPLDILFSVSLEVRRNICAPQARMSDENCSPLSIGSDCIRAQAIAIHQNSARQMTSRWNFVHWRRSLTAPHFQWVQRSDGIFVHHNDYLRWTLGQQLRFSVVGLRPESCSVHFA
jgi:hypothetical protein